MSRLSACTIAQSQAAPPFEVEQVLFDQILQEFHDVATGETFPRLKRQFEGGGANMVEQNQQLVGIDSSVLGHRALEELRLPRQKDDLWKGHWFDTREKFAGDDQLIELSRPAIVQGKVVDEDGSLVKADAKGLLDVKELSTVVIKGKAQRDDAGNLTVLASGVYVKKK